MTAAVEMNTPPHHLTTEIKWDPKQNLEWKQDIYFPVTRVENQLKYVAQKKMLRVSEFFRDFDTLRSGYVTTAQFRSSLDEHLGLHVTDEDFEHLVQKYGQEKPGRMNYKAFVHVMESAFNPYVLDGQPSGQIQNFQRTALPPTLRLPEDQLAWTDDVLLRCHEYYKCRGISVKSCYCDFDRHHRGYVTETQFHRSFPGPPGITTAEIAALAQRYWDPVTGLQNYLRFHDDVTNIGSGQELCRQPRYTAKDEGPPTASIESLLERIKDVVYKRGIRTTEFFRDFDKRRSGVVTANQFAGGLSICCDKVVYLTPLEAQIVVDHFKTPDGRVKYIDFCHLMENAYNVPELEKKPTTDVNRPLRGYLQRPLNAMGPSKEQRVDQILQRIRTVVKERRLLPYTFFSDYEKIKGYTRGVTRPQFERVLHFLNFSLTKEEVKLLEERFECGNGIDVNYTAFTQAIDTEFTGQTVEQNRAPGSELTLSTPACHPLSGADAEMLLARIREHVKSNRIRLADHFKDADPLRANTVTPYRFRQGLSSIGKSDLTEGEFQTLCRLYHDPKREGHVRWKDFVAVIEEPVLKNAVSVPEPAPLPSLRAGALDFHTTASMEDHKCLDSVLYRLSERIKLRRIQMKPAFQDFDWHHIGYVTPVQFRQCLAFLCLEVSEQELTLLDARFVDAKGFNYLQFLEAVEPMQRRENVYSTKLTQRMTKSSDKETLVLASPSTESMKLQEILEKLKIKVSKERVRVGEFMKDYDKLKSGRVSCINFARGLDLCGFGLTPDEVMVLENRYRYYKDPNFVNYANFSDELESVFTTKGLEKAPTVDVEVFVPPDEVGLDPLTPEETDMMERAMHRLADRVRVRRIQLYPLFEDFDPVNIGSVTKSQFQRVLNELELAALVAPQEFSILFRKFEIKVGGRADISYIAFCKKCYEYAKLE